VIKRLILPAASVLAIVFLISACASPSEVMTEVPGSSSRAAVPGEKLDDEGNFAPGPAGSSAGVRW
jgi:hypothetical protein